MQFQSETETWEKAWLFRNLKFASTPFTLGILNPEYETHIGPYIYQHKQGVHCTPRKSISLFQTNPSGISFCLQILSSCPSFKPHQTRSTAPPNEVQKARIPRTIPIHPGFVWDFSWDHGQPPPWKGFTLLAVQKNMFPCCFYFFILFLGKFVHAHVLFLQGRDTTRNTCEKVARILDITNHQQEIFAHLPKAWSDSKGFKPPMLASKAPPSPNSFLYVDPSAPTLGPVDALKSPSFRGM